jgi:hypothetical protein
MKISFYQMLAITLFLNNGFYVCHSTSEQTNKESNVLYQRIKGGYTWGKVLHVPPPPATPQPEGNQVFHVYRVNKSVWNDKKTAKYIKTHMQNAKILSSDAENIKYAVEEAQKNAGVFLEFGVGTGRSINFIAALNPQITVHGFDSFKGLPEDWRDNKKGTFGFKEEGVFPPVLPNVVLHVGLFENVLPVFVEKELKNQLVAFIHIDCDIYSSTKCVFDILKNNIKPGTVIVFDEYFNYPGWKQHEFKAFQEFIKSKGLTYNYLSFNQTHEQVTVQIQSTKKSKRQSVKKHQTVPYGHSKNQVKKQMQE